jgi:hypothetical protein
MKIFILCIISVLTVIPLLSQETIVLKKNNKTIKGKVEILEKDNTIKIFTSGKLQFYSTNDISEIFNNNNELIWPLEKVAEIKKQKEEIAARKEEIAARKKEACEEQKKTTLLILPFKNDKFGRTQNYINILNQACFKVVNNINALEYFNKNNISLESLNDFEIINMAKSLKVDEVFFGDLYIINKPFRYSPSGESTISEKELGVKGKVARGENLDLFEKWLYLSQEDFRKQQSEIEQAYRESARIDAGAFLYETIYTINVNKKERNYIQTNSLVMKW